MFIPKRRGFQSITLDVSSRKPSYFATKAIFQCLQFWLLHKGLKSFNEVFLTELLAFPLLHHTTNAFGWNEDIADNLNDAVLGYSILNRNTAEAIDLDFDESTVTSNIDAQ